VNLSSEAPPPAKPAQWLNRTVLAIGLASLLSDVGHEMATAALPALLASIGANSAMLGLIEGTADALSSFAKLFSGLYSDRLPRRKPLATIGYFLTASGMFSFGFVTSSWQILLGRAFGWLGRGIRSPVRAVLLTEATTKETYGRAFGFERAMDSAGAVVGPLAALAAIYAFGIRGVFYWTLLPGLAAAACIIFLVREKPHVPGPPRSFHAAWRGLPATFKSYLVGISIAGMGDFANSLLILWATQAWTPELGLEKAAQWAMIGYVGYNVVYMLSCYVAGRLADRYPKHLVLAFGYSLAVIPAVALIWPGTSIVKFAIVFGFSGLYMGFWETLEASVAATLLPPEVRGLGFGTLATVNGIGDFASSVIVGGLWAVNPELSMGLVILASLVGAGMIARTGMLAAREVAG